MKFLESKGQIHNLGGKLMRPKKQIPKKKAAHLIKEDMERTAIAKLWDVPDQKIKNAINLNSKFRKLDHNWLVPHLKEVYLEENWPAVRDAALKSPGFALIPDHLKNAEDIAGRYHRDLQRTLEAIVQNHGFAFLERHSKILKHLDRIRKSDPVKAEEITDHIFNNPRDFTGQSNYIGSLGILSENELGRISKAETADELKIRRHVRGI